MCKSQQAATQATLTFSPTCHGWSFNSPHLCTSQFKTALQVLLLLKAKCRFPEWNCRIIRRSGPGALLEKQMEGRGGREGCEGVKEGSMKFKLMRGRWNWRLQYETKERVGAGVGQRVEERQANWFVWGMGRARRDEKARVMGEGWRAD